MRTAKNVVPGEMRIAEQERDDVLLRRAAKGDEEAFTLIYRRHQAAMYRFALRMTGNTWAAEDIVQDVLTPAIWAEKRERLQQVRAAVQELPVEFREAVVLCELEEMSYEEAAQMAGCPIGTIRSRLHRGRALLMAKLEMLRGVPRRASVAR